MHRIRHLPLWTFSSLALLLSGCGAPTGQDTRIEASDSVPLLRAQGLTLQGQAARDEVVRTYSATIDATVITRVPGLPDQIAKSPPGLQVAYLLTDAQVRTRLDYPASEFSDGRARIAVYDSATGRARLLFSDTLAPDPSVDMTQIAASLAEYGGFGLEVLDDAQPFRKLDAAAFGQAMSRLGVSTNRLPGTDANPSGGDLTASRTFKTSGGTTQASTFTFDAAQGVIRSVVTNTETPDVRQTATTTLRYATVENAPNLRLPAGASTTQQVRSKFNGQVMDVTQNLTYANPKLNTLSEAYFDVGSR